MKTTLTFLLMLCAVTALAANPAFQDFNTTQFGVGGNKVAVKGGVLLTNPVVSSGALTGNLSGGTNLPGSGLQASSVNSNRFDAETLSMFGGGGGGDQVWTNDSGVIRPIEEVASTNLLLYPTAENGSVPYFFDTSVAHTTSDFLQLRNQGTNVAIFSPFGGLMMGLYSEAGWGSLGSDDGIVIIRDPSRGDNQLLRVDFSSVSDVDDYSNYGEFLLTVQTNSLVLKLEVIDGAGTHGTVFSSYPSFTSIRTKINNLPVTILEPGVGADSAAYIFDTSLEHTSGNLLELKNNGIDKFTVGWDGAVTAAGVYTGDGIGLTNIGAASLPSNLATNNGNNQFSVAQTVNGAFTNTGYSSTTTQIVAKVLVNGASPGADAVNVTGSLRTSGSINVGANVVASGNITVGSTGALLWTGGSDVFSLTPTTISFVTSDSSTGSRILLGGLANAVSSMHTSTNWPSLSPASKTNGLNYAELSVMAGTNTTEFASLKASQVASTNRVTGNTVVLTNGTVAATEGIIWQGGAQLTNVYTATATLDFGNVATIGCADLTIAVTGAALGDVVDLGVPNASIVANSSYSAWVSAADTVTVRFCALISGDPASGVFRAEVHKWK